MKNVLVGPRFGFGQPTFWKKHDFLHFQDLRPVLGRLRVPESKKSFCMVQIRPRWFQRQPWAPLGDRHVENHVLHVLRHVGCIFWCKFDVWGCAARNVLNNMACRDGPGIEKAVLSNTFLHPGANREI